MGEGEGLGEEEGEAWAGEVGADGAHIVGSPTLVSAATMALQIPNVKPVHRSRADQRKKPSVLDDTSCCITSTRADQWAGSEATFCSTSDCSQ